MSATASRTSTASVLLSCLTWLLLAYVTGGADLVIRIPGDLSQQVKTCVKDAELLSCSYRRC